MMNSLTDSYGRKHTYLRISVTDRCNLRCFYCMPHDGIKWLNKKSLLTFEEIERVSRVFVSLGIDKIRLTGGEPLLRNDLPCLAAKLSSIPGLKRLSMTTNAMLLAKFSSQLKVSGVTHLNISLDSLRKERFEKITGRDSLESVLAGIEQALQTGFESIKVNMVVIAGVNDNEILDFIDHFKYQPVNLRFIEFMPFKNNDWVIDKVFSYKQMLELISEKYKLSPIDTEPSAVAKDYKVDGIDATVSFVTSMTESFCGTCNRVRLTSDGSIKSCLFHPAEVNLRDSIRQGATDTEIASMIKYAIGEKPEAHLPAEDLAKNDNRSMIEIGG